MDVAHAEQNAQVYCTLNFACVPTFFRKFCLRCRLEDRAIFGQFNQKCHLIGRFFLYVWLEGASVFVQTCQGNSILSHYLLPAIQYFFNSFVDDGNFVLFLANLTKAVKL